MLFNPSGTEDKWLECLVIMHSIQYIHILSSMNDETINV